MNEGESSVATALPAAENPAGLTVVGAPTAKEEVDAKLHQAREQLMLLRRQQEELERAKGELEDLRRKQDEFSRGRTETVESLTRALVLLEREQTQAQRLAELCSTTRRAFGEYLEQIHAIRDQEWTSANLRSELTKALGTIENARLEFNRARTKLDCLSPAAKAGAEAAEKSHGVDALTLKRFFLLGAAASLPVIVVGTVWLIIFLIAKR